METTRLVAQYLRQPIKEKALYLEAALLLGAAKIAILTLPFRWLAPVLGQHMASTDEQKKHADRKTVIAVSRAIRTMSRHLPWECKCLAQAISGKMMLQRRRISSTLFLGVAKKEDGDLNAHAWLRVRKIVILGGGGLERFAVVSTFT